MSWKQAAVLEPNATRWKAVAAGVARAGLKVTSAREVEDLRAEPVVVLGSVPSPSRVAREVRQKLPGVFVVSAQARGFKAAWADAVLPLPVSSNDLRVRLTEWQGKHPLAVARAAPPAVRPGDGILDGTTSFYTFTHFKEVLFVEVKRARRYGFPLALALMAFDPIDGALGPELQTQLMGGLSLAIRRSLRDTDYPVQYSPDRVLLLMPHTDLAGSLIVARRITERVARAALQVGEELVHPTISLGVAAGEPGRDYGFSELVRQAQEGLAAAIAQGGNRVEFHGAEDPRPSDAVEIPRVPPVLPPPSPPGRGATAR
jgi:diguanylate cyclase (GGDEF)-like protein